MEAQCDSCIHSETLFEGVQKWDHCHFTYCFLCFDGKKLMFSFSYSIYITKSSVVSDISGYKGNSVNCMSVVGCLKD